MTLLAVEKLNKKFGGVVQRGMSVSHWQPVRCWP